MAARRADWYFDFISPFAYLQFREFHRLPANLEIRCVPVLFAGLLKHWSHKGPAEIPAKRIQTYRYTHWLAERRGIPFRMPPAHPFNPLRLLRLAIALGATREAVGAIFDATWGRGEDVYSDDGFATLAVRLGVQDWQTSLGDDGVKQALHANTTAAIERGVYGVPTFVIDGELFWGVDLTDMFIDYLTDPTMLEDTEMRRISDLPQAAVRKS